jgi:hypothetical protein
MITTKIERGFIMSKKCGKEIYFYTEEDISLVLGISKGAVRVARSRGEFNTSDFGSVFDYMFRKILLRIATSKNRARSRSKLCPRFY